MRLEGERESANVEDERGSGSPVGMRMPGGEVSKREDVCTADYVSRTGRVTVFPARGIRDA